VNINRGSGSKSKVGDEGARAQEATLPGQNQAKRATQTRKSTSSGYSESALIAGCIVTIITVGIALAVVVFVVQRRRAQGGYDLAVTPYALEPIRKKQSLLMDSTGVVPPASTLQPRVPTAVGTPGGSQAHLPARSNVKAVLNDDGAYLDVGEDVSASTA